MADSRLLLSGLEDYRENLNHHLSLVRQEFSRLEARWYAFSAVYEGDAADQFRANWIRTVERFNEYVQHSESIATYLDEHIEHLRSLNSVDPTLA